MKRLLFVTYTIFIVTILFQSCEDDTEVGYGLLGESDLELVQLDDLDVPFIQLPPKPINGLRANTHTLGTIDDSTFGGIRSSIFIRPALGPIPPNFVGQFDSLILTLTIDTTRFFGRSIAQHDISIFELTESIDGRDTIFTDEQFAFNPEPVGRNEQYVFDSQDSVLILDFPGDSSFIRNVMSISLDPALGQRIFQDTANHKTFDGFNSILNGFYITSASENALLTVDLSNSNSGLIFYYSDDSLGQQTYQYPINEFASPLNIEYDITGSDLEEAIDGNSEDDLLYVQGLAGATLEIDVQAVDEIPDPFLNYAAIEIYAQQDSPIDTTQFPYPLSFDLFRMNANGDIVDISDLELGKAVQLVELLFDGAQQNVQGVIKYELKITNFLKSYIDGAESSKIYLTVRNRVQNPNSVVLYGPSHEELGARLNVTYTKS